MSVSAGWVANRVITIFGIIVGLVEIGIGTAIFRFLTNKHYGAWWAGVGVVLTSLLGLYSESFSTKCSTIAVGSFVIVLCMIGAMVDGIPWNELLHTRACYDPHTGHSYGQSSYYNKAYECSNGVVGGGDAGHYLCVQANNAYCFHYDLTDPDKYDGDDLLNHGLYITLLHASTAICSTLCAGILAYLIFLCAVNSSRFSGSAVDSISEPGPSNIVTVSPLLENDHQPIMTDAVVISTPLSTAQVDHGAYASANTSVVYSSDREPVKQMNPFGDSPDASAPVDDGGEKEGPGQPRTLQVTVPDGVTSGQVIQVRHPNGQLLHVAVPAGAVAGTQITFSI